MKVVTEIKGDLFDAPDGAALIHACNCQGSWGKGIARAFRERYPGAYAIYKSHCQTIWPGAEYKTIQHDTRSTGPDESLTRIQLPVGTALLIPPQKQDYEGRGREKKRHWIVCLFTSRRSGRNVDSPATILKNTELAIADMKEKLAGLEGSGEVAVTQDGKRKEAILPPCTLWSCRFNSGLFRVEWSRSRRVLEEAGVEVTVVRPPGES